jgi:hypothetical protein
MKKYHKQKARFFKSLADETRRAEDNIESATKPFKRNFFAGSI